MNKKALRHVWMMAEGLGSRPAQEGLDHRLYTSLFFFSQRAVARDHFGFLLVQGVLLGTLYFSSHILAAKLAKEELMKSKKTFLSELESMESITEIVQKWDAYHLGDSFPEADMYIGIQAKSPHVDLERFKLILVEKLNG